MTTITSDDFPYRGLYAGVSEIAFLAGVSRQYVGTQERGLRTFPWFLAPVGYLKPETQRRPYWFLRDVVAILRANNRLRAELYPAENARPIEDWERCYTGPLLTSTGVAPLVGVLESNVHAEARKPGFAPYADALRMGVVWRETQILEDAA